MKTIFKKLSVVFLALVVFACETENTVIDDVFETVENGAILGIITDGDLRRMLSDTNDFSNLSAADIMSENPKTMDCNALAADARTLMETHEISKLLVLKDNKYSGVIHIHDLIKEGII